MKDDHCPLCRQLMLTLVSAYHEQPFVDGRTYQYICHCCSDVPKCHAIDAAGHITLVGMTPDNLHTASEMVEDGWDIKQAKRSIQAVRQSIAKHGGYWPIVAPGGVCILDKLFLSELVIKDDA